MADEQRSWVRNVQTGQTRTVTAEELADLRSPWGQITVAEATQSQAKSTFPYTRIAQFNAGDQLRLFAYALSAIGITQAAMSVVRIG